MEDPRQVPELVHVLRHSFRPSEQLGKALEFFLPPESKRPNNFLQIKSLGMIAIDAYMHANYKYSNELIEARKQIDKSQNQSLEITPDVDLRQVGDKSVDVLLGVRNKIALGAITLATKKYLPGGILMRDQADKKYAVFARINSSVPITARFQADSLEQYQEAYDQMGSKHLMNILPEGLIGMDQHLRIRQYDSLEEAS
jgi:hypothetical protein